MPGGVQGLDRYAYVNNNPLRYTDPSGHMICLDDGFCGKPNDTAYRRKIIKDIEKKYEITFSGKWSIDDQMAVVLGVIMIGTKLTNSVGTKSAAEAFKETYIPTNFQWIEGACGGQDDRCYADAYAFPNTIRFYSSHWTQLQDQNGRQYGTPFKMSNPAVSPALVIHELGHAFDVQTGNNFNQMVADRGIVNKDGFGIRIGASGQNEVTADLFTNYILGSLGPRTDGIDLQQFMDTNLAEWVGDASNYTWAGSR